LFSSLILDVTPESSNYRRETVLRMTAPGNNSSGYGALKAKLLKQQTLVQKERLAIHFHPVALTPNPSNLSLEITGDLSHFVANRHVKTTRKTYFMQFVFSGGRMLLKEFRDFKGTTYA
jgi:conjugal transfer pilus assembly protein TraE